MNVYLVNEDGEYNCIKAETMKEAVDICLNGYLEEMKDDQGDKYMEPTESEYYFDNVLQSCSLVGHLAN